MDRNHILGKWEDKITGTVLNFYIEPNANTLMLARYQFTPVSFLEEQAPFKITQDTLDSFALRDENLIIDDQHFTQSDRSLEISPQSHSSIDTFNTLVALFNQHYAFFKLRGVNWDAVVQKYQTQIEKINHDDALFDALSNMLAEIGDNHVMLAQSLQGEGKQYTGFKLPESFTKEITQSTSDKNVNLSEVVDSFSQQAIAQIKSHMLDSLVTEVDGKLIWGNLKENPKIGYLNLVSSENIDVDELNASLDKALAFFNQQQINGIVIDARFNQGGEDTIGLAVANRFSHEAKLISSVQTYYDGGKLTPVTEMHFNPDLPGEKIWDQHIPVALLISPITASDGEQFALAISALPQVTVIGEATMGILSNQFARKLPNDWWVTLSNELRYDAHGNLVEKHGLQPDIKAKFPLGEFGSADPGISAALDHLITSHALSDITSEQDEILLFEDIIKNEDAKNHDAKHHPSYQPSSLSAKDTSYQPIPSSLDQTDPNENATYLG
ncbi:MAG: S41 family peptidase [Candidatus Berkiellales bacterium]